MARGVYTLLLACAMPLVLARLWWRGRREPGYRRHLGERFGRYRERPAKPVIWVHAVSVGEVRAAAPLVRAIAARWPECQLLVTCMTAAGRDTVKQVYGESVLAAFLPYDLPGWMRRMLAWFRPRAAVLMETEIWPNMVAACAEHGIPVMLANARLSEKSSRGYARWRKLFGPAFAALSRVCAQSEADAERLRERGASQVSTTGNIKFDVRPDPVHVAEGRATAHRLGRPVIVLASTREREEGPLLDAARALGDSCVLVLVPRHPQRFEEVAALAVARGYAVARRSRGEVPSASASVLLGDTMGEMPFYYGMADVAVIGGSFEPLGGQNLIEACACSAPVVIGPSVFNFAEATWLAVAAGAAVQVGSAREALEVAAAIARDPARREPMRAAALEFCDRHRGATARHVEALAAALTAPAPR